MTEILILALLGLAFVTGLVAVTGSSTERLLWGSVLSSVGLGGAVELFRGGYYGILIIAVFLVSDLVLYLFFRTQKLLPSRPPHNARTDLFYRVFFVWLAGCGFVAGAVALFAGLGETGVEDVQSGLTLLHERAWGVDWLFILCLAMMLVGVVAGGFFLVRRDR